VCVYVCVCVRVRVSVCVCACAGVPGSAGKAYAVPKRRKWIKERDKKRGDGTGREGRRTGKQGKGGGLSEPLLQNNAYTTHECLFFLL